MKTLRERRIVSGMTLLEPALGVGVTPSAVYIGERGQTEPGATNLRDLADALSDSMNDIDLGVWYAKSAT